MSMQVNKPLLIELIFRGTNKTSKISYFDNSVLLVNGTDKFSSILEYSYGKPIGFKLIELNVQTDSVKLINWLQTDFKKLFAYDPLLWLASVATLPTELHQYLIPFHKDTHDTTIS